LIGIAKEGALFTDCYAEQSCTEGQAAFIIGVKASSARD
jgi:arylsulfatase A-like enzyme